jgi:hypothetical protein
MNREQYKTKRKGQPKRIGKSTESKSRIDAAAKERNIFTQPKLRKEYLTKIEWVKNVIPKLKE